MKNFFEVVKERRAIRKFKQKDAPTEQIERIIDSARYAPSALNQQPWEFIVVTNPEKKKKVREIYDAARAKLNLYRQDTSFVENATQIFVCADKEKVQPLLSSALAIENMLLAATALSLGSIVMTAPVSSDESVKEIRALLNVPEKFGIIALVLIGYKDEEPQINEKRALKEILHYEGF